MTIINDKYGIGDILADRSDLESYPLTTFGKVVDVNDPDQHGRIKALCPSLGDVEDGRMENLPWIVQISPHAGTTAGGARTHGMWAVPQLGSEVLVMCLEGNPQHRIYLGQKFARGSPPVLLGSYKNEYGPVDNQGEPINPHHDNQRIQYTRDTAREKACETADGRILHPDGSLTDKPLSPVDEPAASSAPKPTPEPSPASVNAAGPSTQALGDALGGISDAIGGISDAANKVGDIAQNPAKYGEKVIENATQYAKDTAQNIAQGVVDEAVGYVETKVSELVDPILGAVGNILGKIGELGTHMMTLDSKVLATPALVEQAIERNSRSMDFSPSAITESMVEKGYMSHYPNPIPDDPGEGKWYTLKQIDGSEFVKIGYGYSPDRWPPHVAKPDSTKINYGPQTYSWSTPGFHAFIMDDSEWHSRVRLRSSAGHSILFDDTNERIYINSAKGNTWIQLDQAGMVDIYAAESVSIATDTDINMYAKNTIRMTAEKGIHLLSEDEFRIHAKTDLHTVSNNSTIMRANSNIDMTAMGSMRVKAEGILSLHGVSGGYFQAGCALHFKTDGIAYITSSEAHINSDEAQDSIDPLDAFEAFTCTRIPEHEPWGRTWSDPELADGEGKGKEADGTENSFASQDKYTDSGLDRKDRYGKSFNRNKLWNR